VTARIRAKPEPSFKSSVNLASRQAFNEKEADIMALANGFRKTITALATIAALGAGLTVETGAADAAHFGGHAGGGHFAGGGGGFGGFHGGRGFVGGRRGFDGRGLGVGIAGGLAAGALIGGAYGAYGPYPYSDGPYSYGEAYGTYDGGPVCHIERIRQRDGEGYIRIRRVTVCD
jgi:hypothetical protein